MALEAMQATMFTTDMKAFSYTHLDVYKRQVMELSDRILVMYNGEIVGNLENTPDLDEKTIGLYMLGGKRDEI